MRAGSAKSERNADFQAHNYPAPSTAKPTILFADDEENVLSGLRRFLRTRRNTWTSVFAGGGSEALSILSERDVDVIVTDMRMPGVDGAALLEWISVHKPGIVRIVLSGEANIDETYRIIGRSHRFLAKPCAPEVLIDTIEQVLQAYRLEGVSLGGECASFLDCLKTPPEVYTALERELMDARTSPSAVAKVIATDPSLSARILQLVNSAYFSRPLATASIERAVSFLGLDHLRALFDRNRLGQSADGPDQISTRIDYRALAEAARSHGSRLTDDKEILDTIYTAGLFLGLGLKSDDLKTNRTNTSAAFSAKLLGLPQPLILALAAHPFGHPAADEDDLVNHVCLSVLNAWS